MPIQLKDIKSQTKFLVIHIESIGELQIEYRPAALSDLSTALLIEQMRDITDIIECRKSIAKFLTIAIAWWDLYDDDKPFPIDTESLMTLPMSFLNMISGAIADDMSGKIVQ